MTTTTALPARWTYSTRHAFADAEGSTAHDTFSRALFRVATVVTDLFAPVDALDALAMRVEQHTLPARLLMADHLREHVSAEDLSAVLVRMETTEIEVARSFVVVLGGIDPATLPPQDYPALSRYWLACRNALGAL